ncbi:MAG: peptide deformylase [Bacteroidota bacterium]|nr:peptide deformylase [Bacteroidota bacterium]
MNILPITVYGDKILRKKAVKVNNADNEVLMLVKDLFETMRNANGVGIAANQVGSNKSIFVIDISMVEGYEKIKPIAFINPKIVYRSSETVIMEEGCLSIPLLKADVERPEFIKIVYNDTNLKEQTLEADDFLARVIQHEYDHLKGILFTDKVDDVVKKQIKEELIKIKNRNIDIDYPITKLKAK